MRDANHDLSRGIATEKRVSINRSRTTLLIMWSVACRFAGLAGDRMARRPAGRRGTLHAMSWLETPCARASGACLCAPVPIWAPSVQQGRWRRVVRPVPAVFFIHGDALFINHRLLSYPLTQETRVSLHQIPLLRSPRIAANSVHWP